MKKLVLTLLIFTAGLAWSQDHNTVSDSTETENALRRSQRERDREWEKRYRRRNRSEIKTLAGRNHHHGGFGALSFRGSDFRGETIVMAGFRGGWIINRAVAIGFEGHGIIPTAKYSDVTPLQDVFIIGGYGGMFIEPIILSNQVVHITFPIAGGAGWLGYLEDYENNTVDSSSDVVADDVFWYIEPGVALEVNVSRRFRIGVGMTRRFVENLELLATSTSDFENTNYFFTMKFGRF